MFKHRLWLLALCSLFMTLNEVSAQQFNKSHAVQYLQENLTKMGLQTADISEIEVTDNVTDEKTGVTHIFLRQNYQGTPVREGVGSVHILSNGKVTYNTNNYIANLAEKVTNSKANLSPVAAIQAAANTLGLTVTEEIQQIVDHKKAKPNRLMFNAAGISRQDIPVRKYYELNDAGNLRLVWEVEIYLLEKEDWWLMRMDAATGKEISRNNIMLHCSFGGPEHVGHEHYHLFAATPNVNAPLTGLEQAAYDLIQEEKPTAAQETTNPDLVGTYNHFGLRTTPVGGTEEFYALVESPIHGDRTIYSGTELVNLEASPMGWHNDGTTSYTWTQGNNVTAYHNPEGTLVTTGTEGAAITPFLIINGTATGAGNVPDGGPMRQFEYNGEINTLNYNSFLPDALTNLFVGNNVMHDVTFLYGFNPEWGNFQADNLGAAEGEAGDHVLAGGQVNGFANNASFGTPDDGNSGVMKMYIWTTDAPESVIDGDFDAGVIAHEYGHGVSIRMVGGRGTQCLGGEEQGGEGWADFEGLMTTQKDFNGNGTYDEDVPGEGIRGIGNYVVNQGEFEEGIRLAPYTTDMSMNDFTYGDQPNVAAPHGVGFIWCSILWDLNWSMINKYGFEWDIYKSDSGAGNIRTMALVHEAFKYTGCSPSFIDMRDAIFQANDVLYPNEADDDEFMMWEVFARRGLGFSASAGGNEAFDLPSYALFKNVSAVEKAKGTELTYTINVQNNFTGTLQGVEITDELDPRLAFSASTDGATALGQTVSFPAFDIAVGQTESKTFTALIDPTTDHTESFGVNELESAADRAGFTTAGAWTLASDRTRSGTVSYFHPDVETTTAGDLLYSITVPADANAISFWHNVETEAAFDGGVFDISTNGGATFTDLGPNMLIGKYNSAISSNLSGVPFSVLDGRRAFSGNLPWFQTIVDVSQFSGQLVTFRWRFGSDAFEGGTGWWIDDVEFLELYNITNETCVTTTDFTEQRCANIGDLGTIVRDASFQDALAVDIIDLVATPDQSAIRVDWITANETDNRGFEVLRRAENEEEFSSIAYVKGRGDSELEERYTYVDRNVAANTRYYYQLRAYEMSGKSALTNVVSAMINQAATTVEVYPNPAANNVSISVVGDNLTDNVQVEILNATGQLVRQLNVANTEASNISVDVSDLPQQMYMVRITSGDFIKTQQMMIQR